MNEANGGPNIDIVISTTADTTGATQTANSIQEVWGATTGATTATKSLTSEIVAGTAAHESYRGKQREVIEGMHMVALLTGGEVREGFHESALSLRLLGSMTGEMSMGIVGAALVIGQAIPMVVGYFKELYKAGDDAGHTADELKKIGEEAAKLNEKDFKLSEKSLEDEKESVAAVKEQFTLTQAASDKYAIAELTNAEKVRKAWVSLNEVLGIRVNKFDEIETSAAADAQKRQVENQQELDALQKKKADAAERLEAIQKEKADHIELLEQQQSSLTRDKEHLENLKAQEAVLKSIIAYNANLSDKDRVAHSKDPVTPYDAAVEAKETISGADFPKADAEEQGKIEQIQKNIAAEDEKIRKLTNAEAEAWAKQKDIDGEVDKATQTLKETKATTDTVAEINVVIDEKKQFLTDVNALLQKVTSETPIRNQGFAYLLELVKSGEVTAEQLPVAAQAIKGMLGSYQAHFITIDGIFQVNQIWMVGMERKAEQLRQDYARMAAKIGMR